MIKITFEIKDGKAIDSFKSKNQTLQENAVAIRRLEEFKQKLLAVEFEPIIEVSEDDEAKE